MTGICAGFGEPIGESRLAKLSTQGFRLIRQDLQAHVAARGRVADCLEEASRHPEFRWLWICDRLTLPLVPAGSWIEYLNEPEALAPSEYAEALRAEVLPAARDRGLTCWAGSIGNLGRRPLAWLQAVLLACPEVSHVAVHRYPPGTSQDPRAAHSGFRSRAAEVERLRAIMGTRPFLVSEVGYHTGPRRVWWFWHRRLSVQEQAGRLLYERDFWLAHGAVAMVIYQERDGPSDTPIDRYGLQRADGSWKTGTTWG